MLRLRQKVPRGTTTSGERCEAYSSALHTSGKQKANDEKCRESRDCSDAAAVLRDTQNAVRVISHVRARGLDQQSGGARVCLMWRESDRVGLIEELI